MTTPVTEQKNCAICLEEIKKREKISTLNCNHQFHEKCLLPWLEEHETCPLDRGKITLINGIPMDEIEQPVSDGEDMQMEEDLQDLFEGLVAEGRSWTQIPSSLRNRTVTISTTKATHSVFFGH